MSDRRSADGFTPLGAHGAAGLGLPKARARTLELTAAWRRAAGPSVARRTRVVRLRAGTLEVEVPEPSWRRAVDRLLPEIVAKLARDRDSIGIRGARIVDARFR